MDNRLKEIYDRIIIHSSFLDQRNVKKCMEESYDLAITDILGWLSAQDLLSDKPEIILQEWKNRKK